MLGRTSLALGVVVLALAHAQAAAGVTEQPRPLVRVDTGDRSWRLTGSVFSRKTNKVLKVPSWTGTYELVLPTGPGTNRPSTSKLPTITATVYFFPTVERTKDVMISPSGGGFKTDLAPQIGGVDEASGIMLQVGQEAKNQLPPGTETGKHLVEVRARRGSVTFSFTGRPVGVELLPFTREFLKGNRVLGEWKETEIAIDASAGDKKHKLGGSVAADELWRGTVNLAEKNDLTLELSLKRVDFRVESSGIVRGDEHPLEGARVAVEAQGEKLRGASDAEGRVNISIGRVTQRRAIRFSVLAPGQEQPTPGLLTLRYGRDKEKLLDEGKYLPTAAPSSPVHEEVARRTLEFLKAIFNEDVARFPRSLDHDRFGPVEYAPQPHFLHVVTWRLAKESKDKETSKAARGCLPLEKLEEGRDSTDAQLAAALESIEAAVGLGLETGDQAWLHAADVKVRELQALRNAGQQWGERSARACLALWRLAELARDPEREAQAKRETDALVRAISADPEPTETVVSRKGVREIPQSGSAGAHAWAALALWKGFELAGEAGYKATAIAQVQHLVEKHLEHGVVGYSHMQKAEHPELARSTFVGEGAYPETAAAVHALLLTFHHTHDRTYSDHALAIRNRVLGYWRKEYGGFGKLEYWESATAGNKDPKAGLKPLASKRQASAYQQPWALNVFLPTFYPYWGDPVKEERPSRGLLDFLFNRKREE